MIWPKNVTNEVFLVRSHIKNSPPPPVVWGGFGLVVVVVLLALASRSSSSSSTGRQQGPRGKSFGYPSYGGGVPPHTMGGWQHGTRKHIYISRSESSSNQHRKSSEDLKTTDLLGRPEVPGTLKECDFEKCVIPAMICKHQHAVELLRSNDSAVSSLGCGHGCGVEGYDVCGIN